jgi:hypothetical protein
VLVVGCARGEVWNIIYFLWEGEVIWYVSFMKYEYRSGDAARNSMFIVAKAGVSWVCKQWHICIIRLIRDARVGIP